MVDFAKKEEIQSGHFQFVHENDFILLLMFADYNGPPQMTMKLFLKYNQGSRVTRSENHPGSCHVYTPKIWSLYQGRAVEAKIM